MGTPMLLTPLLTGILETLLNRLIFDDISTKVARQKLAGKVLRIELKEYPSPLILVFSEHYIDVLGQYETSADCTVITSAAVVLQLRERQKLSTLMRENQLVVEGDIQVVQQMMLLLDSIEWDLAEWISPYIGDIAAQSLSQIVNQSVYFLKSAIQRQQRHAAETLIEEWRVGPGSLEMTWFRDEINVMARDVDVLLSRLNKVEERS